MNNHTSRIRTLGIVATSFAAALNVIPAQAATTYEADSAQENTLVVQTQNKGAAPSVVRKDVRARAVPGLAGNGNTVALSAPRRSSEFNVVFSENKFTGDSHSLKHVSLKQRATIRNKTWRMNNFLGDQRAHAQGMIGKGYRYSLPAAPFRGIAGRGGMGDTKINWVLGQAGALKGGRVKTFETSNDRLIGLGVQQNVARHWRVGGQAWMLSGDSKAVTKNNFAGAVEYFSSSGRRRHALHLVRDSENDWGLWLDNDQSFGAWRHRYGVYRFAPRLRWINKLMAEDRQGLYWRTDYQRGRNAWFGGLEVERTNIGGNPKSIGTLETFGFAGIKRQINVETSVGGCFLMGVRKPATNARVPETQIHKLKLFLDQQSSIGESHLEARLFRRESTRNSEQRLGVFWNHDWVKAGSNELKTSLSLAQVTRGDETYLVPATGIKFRYAPTRSFELEASMNYQWQQPGTEDVGSYATLSASWQVDRDWRVSLNGRWDGGVDTADDVNQDLLNRIDISLVYQPGA